MFAVRWEREGKSGYMPAYDLDWTEFAKHKAQGGTLKDFAAKLYSILTEQRIINHLAGKEVIGLYPLLPGNDSWFIVADFDENLSSKKSWIEECRLFMAACNTYGLSCYLERSRSGNGGHVWLFFECAFAAYKSRKIALYILEQAGIISPFDKNSSYDRLFPNQDYHTGKGLGNLVALPFQPKALAKNHSCFIDAASQLPFEDQWLFLQSIQKVSAGNLEKVFASIAPPATDIDKLITGAILPGENEIKIILNRQVLIARKQIPPVLILYLRDHLNFVNSDYIIRKKLGKSTFGTEAYFKMLEEKDGAVLLPRGFIGKLLRYCNEQKIKYQLIDERKKRTEINFSFKAALYTHQQAAVDITHKKEMGIIVAPPGTGKTIIGLAIAANKKQPALIIVHRKQLFDQWVESIQSFLGIAEPFIGKIAAGRQKVGAHITVAMIQSLAAVDAASDLFNSFGLIIVDECHHVPAKTFRQVVAQFSSYYLYGLTATPIRKSNDEKLIFIHIGDVIHEIKSFKENALPSNKVSVIIRETGLLFPFDYRTDKLETLHQVLINDTARNQLILEDIKTEITSGRKILVLTERKAHIDVLNQYLKGNFEVITLSGEDAPAAQKIKLQLIKEGHFQVLIATGQFLGEGTDLDNLTCLILAFPFAFEGKLVQYIGRVQRSEITPVIYDYRDIYVDYLEKQFRQRNQYYKKLLHAGGLQKFDELMLIFNEYNVYVNTPDLALPISCLDLPLEAEKFNEGIVWKLRVLNYDEENAAIITEIMDYQVKPELAAGKQAPLQFMIIDKIKFRAIDTGKLLRSVTLKKNPYIQKTAGPGISYEEYIQKIAKATVRDAEVSDQETPGPEIKYEAPKRVEQPVPQPIERTLKKKVQVPFNNLQFLHAQVSFKLFIEELKKECSFEIENPDIRPEFEAVKEYFIKILKRKIITAEIEIRYKGAEIISATATSEDIDKINSGIIDSVRFEFVKKEILGFNRKRQNSPILNTMDNLVAEENNTGIRLFKSEQALIDEMLNIKNSKHYYQLKYLSAQHLSGVLKIRFVLAPFSFLFLLQGDKKYHIVWETLNSEEATYIWHFEKSMEALRQGLKEIEAILNEIKATSKLDYLRKVHDNFSRVMHDYSDIKTGFTVWKGLLEEKLN